MIVACGADNFSGFHDVLKRQVLDAGITFHTRQFNVFTWRGMVEWELELAKSLPADEVLCFVDANDFLFQGSPEAMHTLAQDGLVFHSEAACWPEPQKRDDYPPCSTRFRFVNGTGPLGPAGAIAEAIEYGIAHFPIRGWEKDMAADNDQRFWTDVYLSGRGTVDNYCELSVSLNAVPRSDFTIQEKKLILTQMGTGSRETHTWIRPQFVHANGYSKYGYKIDLESLL